ncbi:MAG: hypothetical protein GPJ54_04220 [Candidatus Heimdallarchaeota archaeon]|nr:hypothetical protein [Candidatus Heimdallarchaeota archaeon]
MSKTLAGVKTLENYISQLLVIENSGLVCLSRRYNIECFDQPTQLLGGFIGALLNFLQLETENNYCGHSPSGFHSLQMIEMSCSKWFVRTHKDYFIIMMVNKRSPLIERNSDILDQLMSNTTTALDIMETFQPALANHVFLDYSEEFGNILDNVLYETISTKFEDEIKFQHGILGNDIGTSVYLG